VTDLIAKAVALREAQDMEAALEVIRNAAQQYPADPRAALGLAQFSFEVWRPAAELFAAARRLMPGNADALRNHALALTAEGQIDAAEALLESALAHAPGWLDGHRILAAQRITGGQRDGFDRSYAQAIRTDPGNAALRMAWFQQHATLKNWVQAEDILTDAREAFPEHRGLALAELFLASESGVARNDDALFDAYADVGDPGLDLAQVRHHLRGGDPVRAEAIAVRHVASPEARMFWPYLSLCWRMIGDDRAQWLDGDPLYSTTFDLDFSEIELAALADVLHGLHRMKAPYPEQSVRGGTQTDRQLFFHPDPVIQAARAKVSKAVAAYIEQLPAFDAAHPLLSLPRNQPVRFEGSWSVRLMGAGYHSSHTHVLGWISSALYVALPSSEDCGRLALGAPPPELELPIQPMQYIEPKPGRLALFPSTMWHCTEPFAAGERLTIAFDVKLPSR
jgi:tetratricopeptide (TPR) repeat protein